MSSVRRIFSKTPAASSPGPARQAVVADVLQDAELASQLRLYALGQAPFPYSSRLGMAAPAQGSSTVDEQIDKAIAKWLIAFSTTLALLEAFTNDLRYHTRPILDGELAEVQEALDMAFGALCDRLHALKNMPSTSTTH